MYEDTPLWIVEDAATLREVAERLARAPAIGVDTESDSFYSYREKVCLLQISDLDTDYIIDPLAVSDLSPLAPIMADERVVKIFHGADYDVVCMKRDFGFEFHNLFDTMIASQMLGFPRVGLADLIYEFFSHDLDKKYQRHDWSQRPLLEEHIEYARGDSHFLPALREILTLRLIRKNRLDRVLEECLVLEKRVWEARPQDPHAWLKVKTSNTLDDRGLRVLKRLHAYRDEQARKLDRPVFKVMGDKDLVEIARGKPTTKAMLDKVLPGQMGMKRRHADALVEAVRKGLDDDFAIPRTTHGREDDGPPRRLRGRNVERAFEALKRWRNAYVAREKGLAPVAVISNGALKEIARSRPRTLDELGEVPDVRKWQVRDLGADILRVLDKDAPWSDRDERAYQARLDRWKERSGFDDDDDDDFEE